MKTVKTARKFEGSPISLRALCKLEDWSFPVSIGKVVASVGFRNFSGSITAGDVSCTWNVVVWRNGFWSAKGDFHDDGVLGGDFFYLNVYFDKNRSVGLELKGSILELTDSRDLLVSKQGSDRWIRDNWHTFEGSGLTIILKATPSVGSIIAKPLGAFVIIAAVSLSGGGEKQGTVGPCDGWENTRDPNGGPCIHYNYDP